MWIVFDRNMKWLVFRFPEHLMSVMRHEWSLTEIACYVPALSGPVASLAVGLLASAAVA